MRRSLVLSDGVPQAADEPRSGHGGLVNQYAFVPLHIAVEEAVGHREGALRVHLLGEAVALVLEDKVVNRDAALFQPLHHAVGLVLFHTRVTFDKGFD